MADFHLVEVNAIHSSEPASNFNQTEIDKLARLILDANGLLHPLILKKTGLEQYEVVSGHLEYYAAVQAKERDITNAEMVNAFVIKTDAEAAVAQQIQLLEHRSATNPSDASQVTALDSLASNLEDMFSRQLQTMTQKLESNLQTISNQIPKQTKLIDAFNQLNEIELARRLMTVGIKGKNLEKLVNQIMSKRPFKTLPEVVEKVNGLSEKKMVEMIDTLSNLLFG